LENEIPRPLEPEGPSLSHYSEDLFSRQAAKSAKNFEKKRRY